MGGFLAVGRGLLFKPTVLPFILVVLYLTVGCTPKPEETVNSKPAAIRRHSAATILPQPTNPRPPALTPKSDVSVMPTSIAEWLERLNKFDIKRLSLSADQQSVMAQAQRQMAALGGSGSPNQQNDAMAYGNDQASLPQIAQFSGQWEALLASFESFEVPIECQGIYTSYRMGLVGTANMMGQISLILHQGDDNPKEALDRLNMLKEETFETVDKPFSEADRKVEGLCEKYHVTKWFNIGDAGQGVFSKF